MPTITGMDVTARMFSFYEGGPDGMRMMNRLMIGGAVLALVGLLAFAIPVFTTQQTTNVARIGDLKLQATESRSYIIPPFVSGGVLILGVVLIAASFYRRR